MKKLFALLALVAFVGVLSAPAATIIEKNSSVVTLDQSFDNDFDKDLKKDKKKDKKKKATKSEAKASSSKAKATEGCGSACGTSCGEATKAKEGSCCGEEKEGKKTL